MAGADCDRAHCTKEGSSLHESVYLRPVESSDNAQLCWLPRRGSAIGCVRIMSIVSEAPAAPAVFIPLATNVVSPRAEYQRLSHREFVRRVHDYDVTENDCPIAADAEY